MDIKTSGLTVIFLLAIFITGCHSEIENGSQRTETKFTIDTVNNISIGDCFLFDSVNLNQGFALVKMQLDGAPFLYDFAPIQLDTSKEGMVRFVDGTMRVLPFLSLSGATDEMGVECLSLWGQDDLNEFLKVFSKAGHFTFNEKLPAVNGSTYLPELNLKELNGFFWSQDNVGTRTSLKVKDLLTPIAIE